MAIKQQEVIEGTEETVGMRLRKARDDKGLSRREVQEQTNIPQKSLEKIEGGQQEPSVSRVQALAELYNVSLKWLLSGNAEQADQAIAETAKTTQPNAVPVNENGPLDTLRGMLADLDDMRTSSFANVQRGAMALVDDIQSTMKYLEPADLLTLATERELSQCEKESTDLIFDLFNEDAEKAQGYCGSIENRIVDTAIFGIDLHNFDKKKLSALVDELKVEVPNDDFITWWDEPDKMELVTALRPNIRSMAISGTLEKEMLE